MLKQLHISFISTVLLILISVGCGAESFPVEAITTAENFVIKIDSEQYKEAYSKASPLLRSLSTEEEWIKQIKPIRTILGPVSHRSIKAIKKTEAYPGLPDGQYVLVYFETEMKNKGKAAEIVLIVKTDNAWQPCSYLIK